jgi:hypothetical protein
MNLNPKHQIISNPRGHPLEFEQVIQEKSQNFVGRDFVFATISGFFQHYNRGYFTIIGLPGSGKSAIVAKYVTENPDVVYYNAQIKGKRLTEEFLATIYIQLINQYSLHTSIPNNALESSWFLSFLLQKISDQLQPHQKLIIAIDALDAVDYKNQYSGANIFYLPRYLPEKVYFILTRRPYVREKSGLLIETPSQTLDLSEFSQQNREDIHRYIQQYLASNTSVQRETNAQSEELCNRLTDESENNFMYISQILPAIAEGFYSQPFQRDQLPPSLEAYYQQHWQKMTGRGLSDIALKVLRVLTSREQTQGRSGQVSERGISAELIAQTINEDEFDVEEVLEDWFEFLQRQHTGTKTRCSFYHSSFRAWLVKQVS